MNYSVIRHASTSLTLPTQSDIMSPRASMGSNNREVILKFVLNNKWTSRHHIQAIDRAPSLDVIKKDIKFVGDRNVEGLPVVWNEAKLDLMARNALNQINSCIANFKDPLRHSSIDESEVIDVRDDDVLEHKNTNNVEHAEYVFDRDAFGNGISWYAVATNSISFTGMAVFRKSGAFFDTGDNYIRVHVPGDRYVKIENIQQLKNEIGKQVKSKLPTGATVSSQELAKAAAFLWAQYTDYLNSIRKKDLSHSYTVISSEDELYHHGVKGMRWGVVHEDDENTARRVGRRLSSSIRRNRQHEGYYNPNVGSASSRTSQGKDKTGTSASSGNDRRVSSKVHKNISTPPNPSHGAVVAAPGVKDKQIESKFNWPGDTLVSTESGITYRLKEKGGKTYEIKYPYDEMKKYDNVEAARYAIPEIVYQYCKDNDLYLTEKMYKAIVYSMSNALNSTYGNTLDHSIIDMTDVRDDEVLEHAQHQGYYSPNLDKNSTSIEQYPYQIGKCYLTRDGGRTNSDKTLMHVVLTSKNGKAGKIPDFVIALNKFNSAGEAVDSFLNTVKNAYPSYWRQAPNSVRAELIRQAVSLYYRNIVKPQHEGYYSPNLLSHSYTIISSEDELYHHGILGQKWGVRRFQNTDGSLTSAGRERYGKL
jgi:hypothetical protein